MTEDRDLSDIGDPQDNGVPPPNLDVYKPKERFIFHYFNGEKMISADPLILYRRVSSKIGEIDSDLAASNFPGYEKADECYERMVANIRKIFKIKTLEEGGLTETELEDLLGQFFEYCHYQKKKWNLVPISQTETSGLTDSLSNANLPTPSSSASGSTGAGPCTEEPTTSPPARPSLAVESSQAWSIGGTSPTAPGKQR